MENNQPQVSQAQPQQNQLQPSAKSVPAGVKIIAVLLEIGAVLMLLVGLAFTVGSIISVSTITMMAGGITAGLGNAAFVLPAIGLLIIVFACAISYVVRSLWRGREWARILLVVLTGLGALQGLFSIITKDSGGYFTLVVNAAIASYLLFSRKVKESFL